MKRGETLHLSVALMQPTLLAMAQPFWSAPAERSGDGALAVVNADRRACDSNEVQSAVAACSAGALHKTRMLFAIWGALLVITRSRRKVTVKNKRQEFMRQLAIGEIT